MYVRTTGTTLFALSRGYRLLLGLPTSKSHQDLCETRSRVVVGSWCSFPKKTHTVGLCSRRKTVFLRDSSFVVEVN